MITWIIIGFLLGRYFFPSRRSVSEESNGTSFLPTVTMPSAPRLPRISFPALPSLSLRVFRPDPKEGPDDESQS